MMTFLAPALLLALPLAALPVIIHLVHLYRRRQVPWAAMMFLQAAQRMNKGLSRLRQALILALRVCAVAAAIFVITRPLAGGWLGLTGGAPDTVLILLDRSASMEQQNAATGISKRAAGLRKLARAIDDAVGNRSRLVLIDSALGQPLALGKAGALTDLPQTGATDTAADIPALLQQALDYITVNKTGRTDVWLLSDLQQTNWDASSGRWEALRGAFGALPGVRFHLLCYPQSAPDDLAVRIDRVARRQTAGGAALLLDLRISRHATNATNPQPVEIPLRFVVNGVATTARVTLKEDQLVLQGYAIPIDPNVKHGWGSVELPADSCPANNVFYFVFDEPPVPRSVIVSDDPAVSEPLSAALSAAADPARNAVTVLPAKRAAEIPWADTALIVWDAPIPQPDEALARQLREHVAAGRTILFLPPESPDGTPIYGLHWEDWTGGGADKLQTVEWWRNDAGLLANTRDGAALPVGALEISRRCGIGGEGIALARVGGRQPLLERAAAAKGGGNVYFLGTLPGPGASSLARDGVVMFALLDRALNEGAGSLAKAQQRFASATALGASGGPPWRPVEQKEGEAFSAESLPLHAGVVASGDRLVALNRPPGEDQPQTLSPASVGELFAGLDYRLLTDTLEDSRSLTNEIWRTFLLAMAACLIGEALLCMPPRRETPAAPRAGAAFSAPPPVAAHVA
jgi:hypothetical protein